MFQPARLGTETLLVTRWSVGLFDSRRDLHFSSKEVYDSGELRVLLTDVTGKLFSASALRRTRNAAVTYLGC